MAIRFSGTTDQVGFSGTLPAITTSGLTVVFWVYLSVNMGTNSCLTRYSAASTSLLYLVTDGSGNRIAWFSIGGSITPAFDMTVGAWHRVAAINNNGSGSIFFAPAVGATSVATGAVVAGDPTLLGVGGRGAGDSSEPFNGRLYAYKMYAAVLSQAEIETEWQQNMPARTSNLHAWYPLLAAGDINDYSGNARNLSAGATAATTEDNPPIPWSRAVVLPPVTARQRASNY